MGQTLTHGVYLPDEGERNCYSGLAANWQLLDNSVGTIAEHTSALAGKAPAVHTHTKSDITDLLSSNFIPSANNSYDLGSSSYQWNNVYSKNYYYNGVAWGLDKENVWTAEQTITNNFFVVKETGYELGQSYPSGSHVNGLNLRDKNGSTVGIIDIVDRSYGNMEMRIRIQQKYDPNSNNRSTSGDILFNELIVGITPDKQNYIGFNADLWGSNHNLGTSTNKWKTFNGINPGALSLPDAATTWEDLTGYVLDGTTENLLPLTGNFAIPGWLCFRVTHTLGTESHITVEQAYRMWATSDKDCVTTYTLWVPCKQGTNFKVKCKADSLQIRFHPCLGNV
jgi:hypothetical protein